MAKRRNAPAPDHDSIRTSVCLARRTHARLSALASLKGCTINALIVDAVEEAVREVVIHDRRKSAGEATPTVLVSESADEAA